MPIFLTLFLKIIPLYFLIVLGYILGKFLNAKKETVARILIYTIAPVIAFYGVLKSDLNFATLSLPFFFFIFCSINALAFFGIGKLVWQKDPTRNLFAYSSGMGNTGYFGLPVAIAIFGDSALSIAVLLTLGSIIYENSLGVYICARGNHSVKESIMKILKLPMIYAFLLALIVKLFSVNLDSNWISFLDQFKGAYTVLGMMLIGLGLANCKLKSFDFKYITMSFLAKFIAWPALMMGFIILDQNFFHIYNPLIHNIMFLLSIVPLAANTIAYATELKLHPDKAAITVAISTIFALFYIPIIIGIFL